MKQLCYNDEFSELVEDVFSNYWKTYDDIPIEIINFIQNNSEHLPIYSFDDTDYYCQKCFEPLENGICNSCSINYKEKQDREESIFVQNITDIINDNEFFNYYCFDVVEDNVLLYKLKDYIYFDNPLMKKPFKTSKITIEKVYLVKVDGIYDLINKKIYNYNSEEFNDLLVNDTLGVYSYIYTENLEKLKSTIYKYSNIWKCKDTKKTFIIELDSITKTPLNNNEFEFLMKNGLYTLAFSFIPELKIKYKKEYLSFIKKYDLSFKIYHALLISDVFDYNFLKYFEMNMYRKNLEKRKYNYKKIKEYFDINNIEYDHLSEYFDYLDFAKKLGYNMKDKKVIYPLNLKEEHDRLSKMYEVASNKINNKNIKKLSKRLDSNCYEDDKYIIYPAHSVEEIIDESKMQNNCVKTYIEKYSNNETQIYFMRKKDNIKKSFVTIEVVNGKVVQAKFKNNESISHDIEMILKKWEQNIVIIN